MKTYVDEYYMALTEQEKASFRSMYNLDFDKMGGNIMVALGSSGGLADAGLMSFSNFMLSIQSKSIVFNPCRVVSVSGRARVFRDCDNDTLVFDYTSQHLPGFSYQFEDRLVTFSADLLVPAVVYGRGEVVMVGVANTEALALTLEGRKATFYSRTRQTIWTKGESSGNYIAVNRVRYNPRGDGAVVYESDMLPPTVCHTGKASCFSYDDELTRLFG